MMADMSAAPTEFVELCDALYGPVLDADLVWAEVTKAMPDQNDVHVRNARIRRGVERGSNAIGITAGALGLAAAARDDRLATGGRVARTIHATGHRMPSFVARIRNPKTQAALATGAALTQVANLGGDALIAGTLGKPQRHRRGKVDKAFNIHRLPDVEDLAGNVRRLWRPEGIAPKVTPTVPKPTAAPKPVQPQTRRAVKDQRAAAAQAKTTAKDKAAGADVATMLNTTSGKVATGTLGVVGANKVNRNRGVEYVPDPYLYGKADTDVTFRGEFTKFDDAKRQAFGWASIVTKDGVPVVDRQGDYITIEDLEDAAYSYVHKSRVGGDMHRRDGEAPHKVSDMIESIVFTPEKIEKMGLPEGFPQGWWVGYQIHDEDTWAEVRKRGRTGFSIHGRGIRKDHSLDDLMGY